MSGSDRKKKWLRGSGYRADREGEPVLAIKGKTHLDAARIDIRRFHAHAWAATLSVVVLPALSVLSLLFFVEPDPPVLAVSAVSLLISAAASFFGSHLWMRREESVEVSFSDLMLWTWWKRQRAEARVVRGAELLGLDASGQPVSDPPPIGRKERLKILHDLSSALESKDPYTHGHSQRVERHSFRVGAALGLSVTDLEDLRLAAALHDVGKIRVSDRILRKPGKLTPEEYKEMQDHPAVGAWMVSSVGNPDVISAVRHHHERFDGGGYPDGISGHDIPLFARIICVADSFDAITSSRPYRARSERERAVRILKEEAGRQFDPMVVDAFLSSLPAPAPVTAALAFLLPGSAGVVRKLANLARDMGGAGVAETVRAAGVTVVLSASVVAPVAQYVAPDRHRTVEVVSQQKLLSSGEVPETAGAPEDDGAAEVGKAAPSQRETTPKNGKKDGASAESGSFTEAPQLIAAEELVEDELLDGTAAGGNTVLDPISSAEDAASVSDDVDLPSNGNGNGPPAESGNPGGNDGGRPDKPGNGTGGGGGKGSADESGEGGENGGGPSEEPGDGNGGAGGNGPPEEPGTGNGGGPSEGSGNAGGSNDGSGNGPPAEPGNPGGNGGGNSGAENPGNTGGDGNGGGKPKD